MLPESGIYPKSKDFQKNGGMRFSRVGFWWDENFMSGIFFTKKKHICETKLIYENCYKPKIGISEVLVNKNAIKTVRGSDF